MGFFNHFFGKPKAHARIRNVKEGVKRELAPLHAIASAIVRAANQCTEQTKPFFPGGETQQEAILRQMYVFYEFVYFFIHMTNRFAHAERFTDGHFEELKQRVYPDVIAVAIDSFMLDWPDDYKPQIRNEFYDNLNSAELEYSTSKVLHSKEYKPLTDQSLLGKLSRSVSARLDNPYNPEVLIQVTLIAHSKLMSSNLNQLVGAAKTVLHPPEIH
jgi:hypothetical protein